MQKRVHFDNNNLNFKLHVF